MYSSVTAPVDVLLVEDDPADTLLMQEALATRPGRHRLHVVRDGVEAMDFLLCGGSYSSAPRPALILLDLNLPHMDGYAVLAELKADEHLRSIPVIVLTSSKAETDVVRSYASHASAYITKPVESERFTEIMRKIDTFYLSVVKLPRAG
ncbi:response regulator [Umezawaea sp. Da 62-37]|uniref:response regulator n=1 Tax=Umezawaea sp. Da 62-37 TaxID=3075927 RepID=UPI0028F73036|nr:response regulator [Umezawaea sp. Da 62-37]WNV83017.1 response regulator [Umezawaea sp. Da 62-37]